MSKGLPLPLAAAMVFGTCLVAGGGGYYLARERFKSPAPTGTVRPPGPSVPEVVKAPAPVAAQAAPAPNLATQQKRVTEKQTKPEPPPLPTLQEVIALAEAAASKVIQGEQEATVRRIKREIDANKKFRMSGFNERTRDTKGNPTGSWRQCQELGLVEMYQRVLLNNGYVRSNPGLQLAIEAHYNRSTKSGTLNVDREAAWVLDAWMTCATVNSWSDVTPGATNAAAYFKGENITPTLISNAIFVYKSLTKND